MTPTDPKFMLVAETIVQALVIVICTPKVVVTVAAIPSAGIRTADAITMNIDGGAARRRAAPVLKYSNIADQRMRQVATPRCVRFPRKTHSIEFSRRQLTAGTKDDASSGCIVKIDEKLESVWPDRALLGSHAATRPSHAPSNSATGIGLPKK